MIPSADTTYEESRRNSLKRNAKDLRKLRKVVASEIQYAAKHGDYSCDIVTVKPSITVIETVNRELEALGYRTYTTETSEMATIHIYWLKED